MAKKKKVLKSKKPRAVAKSKKATVKKQARPAMKASAKKKTPKKAIQPSVAPMSKAAAAGVSRGMQTRYSGSPNREDAEDLELEAAELEFESDESAEELPEDIMPPEYGGEN
jgi:hypothetical protein